jgi:hypothetical protein
VKCHSRGEYFCGQDCICLVVESSPLG